MANLDIKVQREPTTHKCMPCQGHSFSSCNLWLWKLNHQKGWMNKNWCLWIEGLEKLTIPQTTKRTDTQFQMNWKSWEKFKTIQKETDKRESAYILSLMSTSAEVWWPINLNKYIIEWSYKNSKNQFLIDSPDKKTSIGSQRVKSKG